MRDRAHVRSDPPERRALPQAVRRAIERLHANPERLTTAELSAIAGVPPRSLQRQFMQFLGQSPMGYLRSSRLVLARSRLLTADGRKSIAAIATECGFTHLGRFAVSYRRHFGESPSDTLRRREPPMRPRSQPEPRLIAIATFEAPAELELMAKLLRQELAVALGRQPGVVIARHETPARYQLLGSARKAGGGLRLTVQLVDQAMGRCLWGESYGPLKPESHELQRTIETIAASTERRLVEAERARAEHKRPQDLTTHDLTVRARVLAARSGAQAASRSLDLLYRAMELSPGEALPAALAAWCHAQLITFQGTASPPRERARALELSHLAAALDADDALVLTARCAVHAMLGEFDVSGNLLARALAKNPGSPWAWTRSGWLHTYTGDSQRAVRHFARAMRLDPGDPQMPLHMIGIGSAFFDRGRYAEAARWMRRGLSLRPETAWVNRTLAVAYLRLGERFAATAAVDALRRHLPDVTIGRVVAAVPFPSDFLDRVAEGLDTLGLPP